jgi:uncharacterized sporulation protein YeaH/YhbH (DUF444 family)
MQMGEAEEVAADIEAWGDTDEAIGKRERAARMHRAAALVRAQEREIAELRKALEPFSVMLTEYEDHDDGAWADAPTVGELRRARAALGGNNGDR